MILVGSGLGGRDLGSLGEIECAKKKEKGPDEMGLTYLGLLVEELVLVFHAEDVCELPVELVEFIHCSNFYL